MKLTCNLKKNIWKSLVTLSDQIIYFQNIDKELLLIMYFHIKIKIRRISKI